MNSSSLFLDLEIAIKGDLVVYRRLNRQTVKFHFSQRGLHVDYQMSRLFEPVFETSDVLSSLPPSLRSR